MRSDLDRQRECAALDILNGVLEDIGCTIDNATGYDPRHMKDGGIWITVRVKVPGPSIDRLILIAREPPCR